MGIQKKHVIIEFFDETSIENMITCLHYKMDKVIFFGYKKSMTEERKRVIENFLKNRCHVEVVDFKTVNEYNPKEMLDKLESTLREEESNFCYFDMTGGEDLILTSMGMLAERYQIPIHKYDVEKNKLIVFKKENQEDITHTAIKQEIVLNLDDVIGMQGGCINYQKQKDYKSNLEKEEFKTDIMAMWEIAREDAVRWNAFSNVLKEGNKYKLSAKEVEVSRENWKNLINLKKDVLSEAQIKNYFNALQKGKVMTWQEETQGGITYSYKSNLIKDCILDAGSLLELATYYHRKSSGRYSDVRVGVHLDWDGKITCWGKDVENEIDVMTLEGNIPTFISCKNGEISPTALYEIDAIAEEMAGKYAKKELVYGASLAQVQKERAKRMNIVVSNGREWSL